MEYLRNNFRPQQGLNDRVVSKSAVRDAWNHDMTDFLENPLGTEASKGIFGLSALARRKIPYHKLLKIKRSSKPAKSWNLVLRAYVSLLKETCLDDK